MLGNAKSEEELALKLCNVDPLSSSITNFDPYLRLFIKPFVMDFDHKISNFNFLWINPHNAHHTEAM
jgi:hypothetical protein